MSRWPTPRVTRGSVAFVAGLGFLGHQALRGGAADPTMVAAALGLIFGWPISKLDAWTSESESQREKRRSPSRSAPVPGPPPPPVRRKKP